MERAARVEGVVGDLYRSGAEDLRKAIVTATLEHLFERPELARFFADWRDDRELRVAYDEAMEWAQGGGRTDRGPGASTTE